jgi:hypothetical protein
MLRLAHLFRHNYTTAFTMCQKVSECSEIPQLREEFLLRTNDLSVCSDRGELNHRDAG